MECVAGDPLRMEDAALSAFSMFFTQTPSFLAFQRTMEKSKGCSNAQSLFGVHKTPCDNQIRDLLDPLKPELMTPIFEQAVQMIESRGQLNSFREFAQNLLIAIDGTEYFRDGFSLRYLQHFLCS